MSYVILLAAAFVAGAGAVYLWQARTTVDVFVASADVAAYRQISERDVRLVEMDARDVPEDPVVDRDGLVGRYTLAPVGQDKPYSRTGLGPALRPGTLNDLGVVAIPAAPEVSVAGSVTRGDQIALLLSPAADAKFSDAIKLSDVLVLDLRQTDRDQKALVIALSVDQQDRLLERIGTSRLVAVRTRPYGRQ